MIELPDLPPEETLSAIKKHCELTMTGCWEWVDGWDRSNGAGKKYPMMQRGGKELYVHRVVWMVTRGSPPPRKYIMRTCKNSLCVNPNHLTISRHNEKRKNRTTKKD